MEISNGKTGASRNQGWHLVRIAVAGLLLTASALKCWQLATEPIIGTGLLDSRWLLMATAELELFFGIWLLANVWAKPTWAAALACFGLFTCVSLCKAISGHASCGCFGRVPVNPWYTGTLDLVVVLSLLRWRPKESLFTIHRATAALVIWLLTGVPAAFAIGSYTETTLSDAGKIMGDGKMVVLEPEKWVGKQFPLLDYIDIGDRLKEDEWRVLLYHHDCPRCMEMLGELSRIARKPNVLPAALVEMPPYGDVEGILGIEAQTCLRGKLDNSKRWLVQTPVTIVLREGFVAR